LGKNIEEKFPKKVKLLLKVLENKNIFKINMDTEYILYLENSKIYYGNYCYDYNE
jgi:hypothetical protein